VLFDNGSTVILDNGWPSLSASAGVYAHDILFQDPSADAGANLTVKYSFVVSGPAPGSVPVYVIASGSVTGLAPVDEFVLSHIVLSNIGNQQVVTDIASPTQGLWNISGYYNLAVGQIYTVTLAVSVEASVGCTDGSLCIADSTATVDPMIYIDPSFASASDYTIVFSDGINVGSIPGAVPEPSTWAMMLLGFAGLGFAFRRSPIACT
jgi:hypothetical protein